MSVPNNTAYKNYRHDWQVDYEEIISPKLQLRITTTRRISGKLVTIADVGRISDGFVEHTAFQDFARTYATSTPTRITKPVTLAQHATVIATLADIRRDALSYYGLSQNKIANTAQ